MMIINNITDNKRENKSEWQKMIDTIHICFMNI